MQKKISLPLSTFLPPFQAIFELSIAIDMNTIVNSNIRLGTQFIAVDINVIANSNVKLAIHFLFNIMKSK